MHAALGGYIGQAAGSTWSMTTSVKRSLPQFRFCAPANWMLSMGVCTSVGFPSMSTPTIEGERSRVRSCPSSVLVLRASAAVARLLKKR